MFVEELIRDAKSRKQVKCSWCPAAQACRGQNLALFPVGSHIHLLLRGFQILFSFIEKYIFTSLPRCRKALHEAAVRASL